ncbi:hypothetical protein J7337_013037 [Fusarium musae]|uniref:Hydrophobin n=1 Tax=Fusarium musae TaxID=1042133 RepID=A0A9P8D6X7_9HYPO|nr:hypothetical protein J7337_013037 [Fusarium musae]KAG9496449.1 hypothetical protein J7337_013037 [Fusarium musae]
MKASIVIFTVFAAMVAATPVPQPEPQCAGCEPSGKGSSGAGANASSNNTNTNNNENNISVGVTNPGGSGGSSGGGNSGGNGDTEPKGSCKACIDFCTGRGDLIDGVCKAIVCGIDCIVI